MLLIAFKSAVFTLILILYFNLPTKALGSSTPPPSSKITQQNPARICGTLDTSTGKTVTLKVGVNPSPEEFNNIRNITLNKSHFSPVHNCAIQICGYMPSGPLMEKGYIGSYSDFSKCVQFTKEQTGTDYYNAKAILYQFNTISCGCKTPNSKCIGTCTDTHRKTWSTHDCAVLYEEESCKHCYLPQIQLSPNQNYTTNNSHHITSLTVRPQCKVLHYAPAIRWMYWLRDRPQPLVYEYMPKKQHDHITSPYQPEPETFHCICEKESSFESSSESLLHIPKPSEKHNQSVSVKRDNVGIQYQSGGPSGIGSWNTAIGASMAVLISATILGILLLRRKLKWCGCGNGNQVLMESGPVSLELQPISQVVGPVSPEPDVPSCPESLECDAQVCPVNLEPDTPVCPVSSPGEGQQDNMGQGGAMTNEHKLEEKIDEVKKLLELFLGGGGASLSNEVQRNVRGNSPLHKNDKDVAAVEDQFKSVCRAENIVSRDKILFRKEGNCLGKGQFGTVYKGLLKPANDWDGLQVVVAVKVIDWEGCKDEHVKSFLREIKMFQDVGTGSTHIVKLMGACVHEDGLFILTQFCDGGSLKDYLVNELRPNVKQVEAVKQLGDGYSSTTVDSKKELSYRRDLLIEKQLIGFSEQIACGMEWLEGKGIIHGDLAVRNVLLSGNGLEGRTAKICDLGLSRKCVGREYVLETLGHFPYNSLAPELCKSDEKVYKLSSSVDVWAYGCTLFEIFTLGDCVYSHVQLEERDKLVEVMRLLVFEGYRHPRPEIMPDDAWDKMKECWDEEPENRPSFTELRQFFAERGAVRCR